MSFLRPAPSKYEIAEADMLELHEAFMRFHDSVQAYLQEVNKNIEKSQ